jgi:hypothetical protein
MTSVLGVSLHTAQMAAGREDAGMDPTKQRTPSTLANAPRSQPWMCRLSVTKKKDCRRLQRPPNSAENNRRSFSRVSQDNCGPREVLEANEAHVADPCGIDLRNHSLVHSGGAHGRMGNRGARQASREGGSEHHAGKPGRALRAASSRCDEGSVPTPDAHDHLPDRTARRIRF